MINENFFQRKKYIYICHIENLSHNAIYFYTFLKHFDFLFAIKNLAGKKIPFRNPFHSWKINSREREKGTALKVSSVKIMNRPSSKKLEPQIFSSNDV